MTDEQTTTKAARIGWTVVAGNNYWGGATDLATAKRNFTAQGGRLSHGYEVLVFDQDTEFCGIDQMGTIHFKGNSPTRTSVVARRAAVKGRTR